MRFEVLGPLRITATTEIALNRPAHRRLISIMLLAAGRPLDSDLLIDRLWGEEPPATARAALQTYVSQLRNALGQGLIVTVASGYHLEITGHDFDSRDFETSASAARTALESAAWDQVRHHADSALALWRGTPFSELQFDEFALPEIARLGETRLALIEMRAEALLALGRVEQALPELEQATTENPLREHLWELLMTARVRAGRPAEALSAYQQLRANLGEIGLDPSPPLRDLEERIFQEDPSLVPPRVHHNLPTPIASFIGRRAELVELREWLRRHRLVTLTGVGGAGKTRLATDTGRSVLSDYPDGVYLVDLAGTTRPDGVVDEVALTMGLSTRGAIGIESIIEALHGRRVLLLMDNCEHLLDAVATLVRNVLSGSASTTVLATSREALGIAGEAVYFVPPLAVPPADETDPDALRAYDAVQLFTDRARLVDPTLNLSQASLLAIAQICRRLDGLPLAIELAAARVSSMEPTALARRLSGPLRLAAGGRSGSGPRHRTLEAAIDWSYRLLDEHERLLLERLSVFAGDWPLEAAEAACADEQLSQDEIAPLVSRLVERSLVARQKEAGAPLRYRLLETIREFAGQRLKGRGDDAPSIRHKHRDWYLDLAAEANDHIDAPDEGEWLERLKRERDNLAAALDWSLERGDGAAASQLAEALGWHWARLGYAAAAVRSMRAALETLDEADQPERAAALHVRLAGTLYTFADEAQALEETRRARELVRHRPPSAAKVRALTEYASLHQRIVQQDPAPAVDAARDAIEAARAIADRFAETHALRTLGTALSWAGRIDEGLDHLRAALAVARSIDSPTAILGVYMRLYITQLDMAHDDAAAAVVADEALQWLDDGGDQIGGAASLLMWFASGSLRAGRLAPAEALLARSATYHFEGAMWMSYFSLRALLRWMQGRLTEARTELKQLRGVKATPRYFRLLYPLAAEVAADEGHLDEVRALAEEHLAAQLIPAEEPSRSGTLRALARAEIDAAQSSSGAHRRDHIRRAHTAVATASRLLERHPPTILSGLTLEPPAAWLALAEAELTRVDGPSPDAWHRAADASLFTYSRLYASWRAAQSLLALERPREATAELQRARSVAQAMGAQLMRGRVDDTARRGGLALA